MHIVSCFAFHLYHILTSTENGSGKIIKAGKEDCVHVYEHVCTRVVSYGFEEEQIYDSVSFTFSVLKNS